jgi:8-oxo-dGTP pyrophosphatase MutT (NUDIX family)
MLRPLATLINRALRLYWRVRRPRTFGVRAFVFGADGHLLLVKHTYDRYWYLPGGGRKESEPAEQALARELREELGIRDARIERRLATYFSEREGKRDTIDIFVVRADSVERLQRLEIAAAQWFDLDALPADVSPATLRRIEEYRGEREIGPIW